LIGEGIVEEKLMDETLPDETRDKERPAPSPGPARSGWTNCLLVGVGGLLLLCIAAVVGGVMITSKGCPGPSTPTPTPTPVVDILKIRRIAKLESAEVYAVAELSHFQVPEGWLQELGLKEEIFVLEYGTVVAGFDLTALPKDALWQDGGRVLLKLPPPEILRVEIDFERSHVVYRKGWCPSVVCGDDVDQFLREMEPQAVDKLEEQAIDYGILDRAAESGRDYFTYLLTSMGFDEVRVVVDGHVYE
jgi:hypothetical protein